MVEILMTTEIRTGKYSLLLEKFKSKKLHPNTYLPLGIV